MPKSTDTRPRRRKQAILSAAVSGGWLLICGQVGSGKTHLVLKTTVTNTGAVPVDIAKIAGVTIGTTACSAVLESADGSDLSDTGTVDPGQSRTVYFAAVFGADQAGKKASVTLALPFATHRLTATAKE